ncbi:hypothetical protein CP980_27580 [Streptomyces vinaceus]|uniref:Uncharacterized protein n=1 Tax=Streptomyces vinaceus TaxID=1960 RepID=A0A5J6JAY9_STRVI|nr:hypothetical protein CP980_27580 [Streptomyces vinaceus]
MTTAPAGTPESANSSAGTVHRPPGPASSTRASAAMAATGRSVARPAAARFPPAVPRLRTWGSPLARAAAATSGASARTTGWAATSASVFSAPIRMPSSVRSMPRSSSRWRTSTRSRAVSSPERSPGSRLWPPASTRAPRVPQSRARASSRPKGRT